jgi:tungstate transport system ATP-binding protein
VIEIRDLLIRRDGRIVLRVDRLTVSRGEVLAILGPNGAGKTTLLLALARLLRPECGRIRFESRSGPITDDLAYRRRLSVVLQDPLLLDRSVFDNVAAGLRFRSLPAEEVRRRTEAWLEKLSITSMRDRPGLKLSGGEAQRVALARAFVLEPELLLLDEPFSSLDTRARAALRGELRRLLSETRTTTIFITHDPTEVEGLATRTVWLEDGRLVNEPPAHAAIPA